MVLFLLIDKILEKGLEHLIKLMNIKIS